VLCSTITTAVMMELLSRAMQRAPLLSRRQPTSCSLLPRSYGQCMRFGTGPPAEWPQRHLWSGP
jgi:hypothetical protein